MVWKRLCSIDSLEEERIYRFDIDEDESVIVVKKGGEIFVLENRCSHDDYPLDNGTLVDGEIQCAKHGARFCLKDGRATRMPAVAPVSVYAHKTEGNELLIEVEE